MTTYNRHDNSRQHIERDCQPESGLFGRQTVQGFLRNNLTFDHARVNVTRFPLGTTRQKRAARRASRLTLHELIPDAAPPPRRAGRGPPLQSNGLLSVYLLRIARFKVCRQGGINKAIFNCLLALALLARAVFCFLLNSNANTPTPTTEIFLLYSENQVYAVSSSAPPL